MGDAGERATDDGKRSLLSPGDGADLPEDRDQDRKAQHQGDRDLQDQTGPPRTPVFVLVLTGFSALGGFLLGYDTGVVSGAMLPLRRELHLDPAWQTWLVCSAVAAAAVAALLGGAPHAKLGRRGSALLAAAAVTAGGLVMGAAPDKETLLAGRVLVGLGIGLSSMTVPVYIAEVSPPHLRGMLVTLNNVFITGGQLAASLVDGAFSATPRGGWRYMLGLSVAPALLQFVGFLFLPESPRWLLQKGRSQESRAVLQRIRGGKGVEEELDSIKTSMEEEAKEADGGGLVICRMLGHAPTRRALTVGCGMQMFQQLCGINTVMYFSATILQMAGVRDDKEAIWLTSATAGTNFLFTLVGVWLVERVGRRRLSLWSMLGTALSLCVLAVGFLLAAQNSPPVSLHPLHQPNSTCTQYGSCEVCMLDPACGFCYRENATTVFDSSCLPTADTSADRAAWGSCSNQTEGGAGSFWAYNYCPTSYSWVVLLGLILYLAAFAPGMGPMPWTVNSEIYPLWARSTGNACSAGVNWVCNVLVSLTFLQMAQLLTYHGAFFLYAAVSALGVLFILACLPETQGLQLEEMEGLFAGRLCSFGAPTASDAIRYSRVTSSDPRRPLDAERSDSD